MEYSVSDYHHVPSKPVTRRSSTRVSLQGDRRRQSQYSILDEDMPRKSRSYRQASVAGTEESYDPFRTSRNQIAQRQADHARITVLRGSSNTSRTHRPSGINVKRASLRKTSTKRDVAHGNTNDDVYSIPSSPPIMHSAGPSQHQKLSDRRVSSVISKPSFVSNVSIGRRAPVRKSMSYKRGVSFVHTHANKRSTSAQKPKPLPLTLNERYIKDSPQYASSLPSLLPKESPVSTLPQVVRSNKTPTNLTEAEVIAAEEARAASRYWKDDARKVSNELEKFCDEAFNRSSVASTVPTAHTVVTDSPAQSYGSPSTSVPLREDSDVLIKHPHRPAPPVRPIRPSDLQRPLPKPPVLAPEPEQIGSYTQQELARTRDLLKQRAADPSNAMAPGCLDDVIAHLERLMQPSTVRVTEQRRFVSTPNQNSPAIGRSKDTFDSLLEKGNIGFRSASEPVRGYADSPRRRSCSDKEMLHLVPQPGEKPISPTKPLTIRKKSKSPTFSEGSIHKQAEPSHFTRPHTRVPSDERRIAGLSQLSEDPLESIDEDKENFDPLPRNPNPYSGPSRKRNWFRRQQQASRTPESPGKGSPTPLKDLQPFQDYQRSASPEKKRTSDVPREEQQASDKKQQQSKGKGKFFKIFSKHRNPKPDRTSGGKSPLPIPPP